MTTHTTLTIDVGTTAIKLFLYQGAQLIHRQEHRIKTYTEADGKVYQKPEELLETLHTSLLALNEETKRTIDFIALSTAMHSLLPVFDHGYGDILIWSDQQAASTVNTFRKTAFSSLVYEKTGTPIHYMSPFSKLLWIKETHPFPLPVKQWIGLKELIADYFTGEYILDYSTASATGLFNSSTLDWDDEILAFLAVNRTQLAQLVDTDTVLPIEEHRKQALGLNSHTQLLIGASDGCLAALAGYLNTGLHTSVTLGTSGAVRKLSTKRELDPNGKTFCYYLAENLWVCGGPTNNGGAVLEWVSNLFFDDSTTLFDQLGNVLSSTSPGANGLQFLPFINGERAPMWNPFVKGSYQGITMTHRRSEFIRATVEGMILNLKMIMETVEISDEEVSINGGVFRHTELTQLTANILGKDCLLSAHNEPGFGLLGLQETDLKTSSNPSFKLIKKDNEQVQLYQSVYQHFIHSVITYENRHL